LTFDITNGEEKRLTLQSGIKDWSFDGFIGSFDLSINCGRFIDYFDFMHKSGLVYERSPEQENPAEQIRDSAISTGSAAGAIGREWFMPDITSSGSVADVYAGSQEVISEYSRAVSSALFLYSKKFIAVSSIRMKQDFPQIQKTEPGQGYHVFHYEINNTESRRVLATMLYLNDDFDGGETEFLYQSKRVKPEAGKLLIWPADWTHSHRGNPPLSGDKFVATSWVERVYA